MNSSHRKTTLGPWNGSYLTLLYYYTIKCQLIYHRYRIWYIISFYYTGEYKQVCYRCFISCTMSYYCTCKLLSLLQTSNVTCNVILLVHTCDLATVILLQYIESIAKFHSIIHYRVWYKHAGWIYILIQYL